MTTMKSALDALPSEFADLQGRLWTVEPLPKPQICIVCGCHDPAQALFKCGDFRPPVALWQCDEHSLEYYAKLLDEGFRP